MELRRVAIAPTESRNDCAVAAVVAGRRELESHSNEGRP